VGNEGVCVSSGYCVCLCEWQKEKGWGSLCVVGLDASCAAPWSKPA